MRIFMRVPWRGASDNSEAIRTDNV